MRTLFANVDVDTRASVAHAFNVQAIDVLLSTDLGASLDSITHIHNRVDGTTYLKPTNVGAGEVLVQVSDDELVTNVTSYLMTKPSAGADYSSTYFDKSVSNEPAFIDSVGSVITNCDLTVNVGGVVQSYVTGVSVTLPVLVVGTDYAIYATTGGLVASDNFTVPSGYTAQNSRRVGGFHYGATFIYPRSFWDLKFRPACDDPRGMVRSFMGFWADIYLLNTTPDILGTSAYNVQIADGASTPKKPSVWGGDGIEQYSSFTQYIATEVLAAYGKRLPSYPEFSVLAHGSVTGHNYGVDPNITLFDTDSRSLIGCEQVSGHTFQWGADISDRGDGNVSFTWRNEDTDGKGYVYADRTNGLGALIFGAKFDEVVYAGSRAVSLSAEPWHSSSDIAARGICDHVQSL